MKARSRARAGLHLDAAAVRLHDHARDAQPQAVAIHLAAARVRRSVKAIKHTAKVFLGDAHAVIRHGEPRP